MELHVSDPVAIAILVAGLAVTFRTLLEACLNGILDVSLDRSEPPPL